MVKKIKKSIPMILIVLLLINSPSFQWLKSIVIMSAYSQLEERTSLLKDRDMRVVIPGGDKTPGKDWYPFVMTFNDDYGFSRYVQKDMRMTVLYNFGYFSPFKRQSTYYDITSPYYNSFYGAYAVSDASGEAYGYDEGIPNLTTMGKIPEYDMTELVLESIGSNDNTFDYEIKDYKEVTLLGDEGWIVYDAQMSLNGSLHTFKKDYQAYIQYGRPPSSSTPINDFEVVDMSGRIYAKYFEPQNVTLFFYCIAKKASVIEAWEKEIMANTIVEIKN